MRDYEIVYIFRSSLTSEEVEARVERYHAIIADGSGEVTASAHWGKRQFAYPIRKQKNGYYVVVQFTSGPESLTELERVLKLDDDVLRYLVVIAERPLPAPEGTADEGEAAAEEASDAAGGAAAETAAEDGDPEDGDAEDADAADAEEEAPEDAASEAEDPDAESAAEEPGPEAPEEVEAAGEADAGTGTDGGAEAAVDPEAEGKEG